MNIVVTGCGKGIGRSIVIDLAKEGHTIMGCARTRHDLQSLKEQISTAYPKAVFDFEVVDVADADQVKAFGESVLKKFSHIDVLINNAGVFRPGTIHEEDANQLELMIKVNLMSAYHLSRTIIPSMKKNHKGQIINICSVASIKAYPNGGSYAISKFALYGMTKCLREELKPHGIRVNAILPGATWSNSWDGFDAPEERLMQAEDVAKAVHLCISLRDNAVVEELIIRPQLGDL